MKTLIIHNNYEKLQYAILDGDYSRFNGVRINGINGNGFEDEFHSFITDTFGNIRIGFSSDVSVIENKKWDKVAVTFHIP